MDGRPEPQLDAGPAATPGSPRARRALLILLALATFLLGYVIWPFRGPMFIAAVLAAAFQPILRRTAALLRGRRRSAGGLLTLLVLAIVIAPFATVIGFATQQVLQGLAFLRDTLGLHNVNDLASARLPGAAHALLGRALAFAHLTRGQLARYIDQALAWAEHAAPAILAASGEAAFHTVILLGAFYFLLLDGDRVVRWVAAVSPLRQAQTHELIEEFRKVAVATLPRFSSVSTSLATAFSVSKTPTPVRRDGLEVGDVGRVEQLAQLFDRRDVRQVALVVLDDVGELVEVVALLGQVGAQVLERLDVGLHALDLRVGDEDHAVDALQDQLAAGVVEDLAGHRVEVEARLEAADLAERERQEVEEQRALGLRREGDHLALRLGVGLVVDVLEVRRLPAETPGP